MLGRAAVFDGIWPSLVGTLSLVLGASALALPLGLLAGVHLSEARPSRGTALLRWSVDLLAGIPSIIMGWFGFGVVLLLRRTLAPDANTSLLLAMICLALLVLPYLVRTTETALAGLPESLRLAGPALGLSPAQSLLRIQLPAARRGLLGGVFLAIGRVAEDTAVILMTGVVANAGLPSGLTGKFQALPFDIYVLAAESRGPEDLQRAFGTALVLLLLTGGLFALAHAANRELEQREGGT
jgi:phosphate transport system permease protein